jgi:hypothetical protein
MGAVATPRGALRATTGGNPEIAPALDAGGEADTAVPKVGALAEEHRDLPGELRSYQEMTPDEPADGNRTKEGWIDASTVHMARRATSSKSPRPCHPRSTVCWPTRWCAESSPRNRMRSFPQFCERPWCSTSGRGADGRGGRSLSCQRPVLSSLEQRRSAVQPLAALSCQPNHPCRAKGRVAREVCDHWTPPVVVVQAARSRPGSATDRNTEVYGP